MAVFPGLDELHSKIFNQELTSRALVEQSLARIDERNARLNAFIHVDRQGALKRADELDKIPPRGALHGLPIAIKDLFMQRGQPTTCASKILQNFVAPFDATVVERLKQAGAVIVGKTNMDEFAMGSTNRHSHFGATLHPFDQALSPGGSSGGSAVAVASGMVPVALGSDTGGSVRQPAALCGIVGLKPTYGRISRYGMIAYASSLDQCGIFSRRAADAGRVLQVLAGQDVRDATSSNMQVDDYTAIPIDCRGLKLGVAKEFFDLLLSKPIRASLDASIARFSQLGAEIVEVSIPHFRQAVASYYITATAEASSNLARFDGVRYGHRATSPANLEELYTRSRSEGFGNEVQRRILLGVFVLSSGYFDAYYLKAQRIRRLICQDFAAAFARTDALIAPVTPAPCLAPEIGSDDPTQEYLADIYTVPVNLAGLPAISFPCHKVNQPQQAYGQSCQLIGPHWSEAKLLRLLASYEAQLEESTEASEKTSFERKSG